MNDNFSFDGADAADMPQGRDCRLRLRGFFYPGRFQKLLSGFLPRRLMLFYRTASCVNTKKAAHPNCNQNHPMRAMRTRQSSSR